MIRAALFLLRHAAVPTLLACLATAVPAAELLSPDGTLRALVGVGPDGRLGYRLERSGTAVLGASALGLIVDGVDHGTGVTAVTVESRRTVDRSFPMRGVHSMGRDHHVDYRLRAERPGGPATDLVVEVRMFDQGMAVRYRVPGSGPRTIAGEFTSFTLPPGATLWYQTDPFEGEGLLERRPAGEATGLLGAPVTAELPGGGFAAITEAALYGYSGMALYQWAGSTSLYAAFPSDGPWESYGGIGTPWRVILASPDLDGLLNADLVQALNPEPRPLALPGGVEAGWLGSGRALTGAAAESGDPEAQGRVVERARSLGFEYVVLDRGWEAGFAEGTGEPFSRLSALADRADPDVGLWVWKDVADFPELDAAADWIARARIAGVRGVQLAWRDQGFERVATQADLRGFLDFAAYQQLLVGLEGVPKPTGLTRRYPNLVTRDAVLGPEPGATPPPWHGAALAFTRALAGDTDVRAGLIAPERTGGTTAAHQVALTGALTSGLVRFADDPDIYAAQPASVRDVLRRIPARWDETRVLPGSRIGYLTLMARRAGDRWFLFAVSGDPAAGINVRDLALDFLGVGSWDAEVLGDDPAGGLGVRRRAALERTDALDLELQPGGGAVVVFEARAGDGRAFRQGFETRPGADGKTLEAVGTLGDVVVHRLERGVPWEAAAATRDPAAYPAPVRAAWDAVAADTFALPGDHARVLVVSPADPRTFAGPAPLWDGAGIAPAAPWRDLPFDDPALIEAWTNYLIATVERLRPTHLAIGARANRVLAAAPVAWTAYKALNAAAYEALRARYPDLVVFSEIDYEHYLGRRPAAADLEAALADTYPDVLRNEVRALLAHSDLVGVMTQPALPPTATVDPAYYEPLTELAVATGRPVAVTRAAWPSRDVTDPSDGTRIPGSEADQAAFLTVLLEAAWAGRWSLVVNGAAVDDGLPDDTLEGRQLAAAGLRGADGSDRAALAPWVAYLDLAYDGAGVGDAVDSDGDGVTDAEDCAPEDPALAHEHTFHADLDDDHAGDPVNVLLRCTLTPPPPYVAWDDDPSDGQPQLWPEPLPKGDRVLGLDFADGAADGTWRQDLARELGAEAVPHGLTWRDAESAPGVFDGPAMQGLKVADALYAGEDLAVSLAVNPIEGGYLAVPEDLRAGLENGTVRWTDPAVLDRFRGLLEAVHEGLPNVRVRSLRIGHEVDLHLRFQPRLEFWADYREFAATMAAHARLLWGPELPVGVTATHVGLLDPGTRDLMASVNASMDVVSATYRAVGPDGAARDPEGIREDVAALAGLGGAKPVHLEAVAFTAAPALRASTTTQSQSLNAFFGAWDTFAEAIPYAAFARLHDLDADTAAARVAVRRPFAPEPEERFAAAAGLRTRDGTAKPAYHTLRNLAFNRHWWRLPEPTSRSFRMGFSHNPFDAPPDEAETREVLAWTDAAIAAEGDFLNIQLDSGVPWVEAFTDDGSAPEAPYSWYSRLFLQGLVDRRPPDGELMVAISAIGNPRGEVASYMGVGQGFRYQSDPTSDNFVMVPEGPIEDGILRYPPPPWNRLPLDAPEIRQAFTNYAKRIVRMFAPDYLLVALEASETQVENERRFEEFLALQEHVFTELKADPATAEVPLIVSISSTTFMTDEFGVPYKYEQQLPGKRERLIEGLRRLLPWVDVIGLSHYPHFGKYNANIVPAFMYDKLFEVLEEIGAGTVPVAVTESGYSADTYSIIGRPFYGTPEKQDLHFKLMFHELEKASNPVRFVVNHYVRDKDLLWQRQLDDVLASGGDTLFSEFNQYFRDIGLFDGEGGADRPALQRWRDLLAKPLVPEGGED